MANAPENSRSAPDFWIFIIVPFLALMLIKALWGQHHAAIATLHAYVRLFQLWPLYALAEALGLSDVPGLDAIVRTVQDVCDPVSIIGQCRKDFSDVSWGEISGLSVLFNLFWLLVAACVAIKWIVRSQTTHPQIRFTKKHDLKSFMTEMRRTYPRMNLYSRLDLIGRELDDPVFGMSMTSRDFAREHDLVRGWSREGPGRYQPILDRQKCAAVFLAQLGRLAKFRKSPDPALPDMPEMSYGELIIMSMLAPLVAATDRDMDEKAFARARAVSQEVHDWCWTLFIPNEKDPDDLSWTRPDIDLSFPRSVLHKYIKHPNVQAIFRRHAYLRTVLYGMMVEARRIGVFNASRVDWLRFHDRPLWYAVTSMGRPDAFAEGSAVFNHFMVECKAGRPVTTPCTEQAIDGLRTAITSFLYTEQDRKAYDDYQKRRAARQEAAAKARSGS